MVSHEDLVAAAEGEGAFTWCTSMTAEVADALVAAFAKDYPKVKTEIVKSNTAGLLQPFLADHSRRRMVADVVTLADFSSVNAAKQVGALQDYVPEDVMSLVRADSRVMEPTALTMYVAAFPWGYRVDAPGEVVEALKRGDWEMFADPRIKELLKGRVVSTDPSAGGAPLSSYESLKYGLGDAKFESFLKNFGEMQPVFFNSNVPTIEAVSSGERLAGRVADVVALPEAVKNPMLRVQYFSPTPGYVRTVSLAAGSVAQVDLRMLMTRRGAITAWTLRSRSLAERAIAVRETERAIAPLLRTDAVSVPVTAVYARDDVADAYEAFRRGGKFGKIVIRMGSDGEVAP